MMTIIEKSRRVIWISVLTVLLLLAASFASSYLYDLYNGGFEPVNVEIEQKGNTIMLSAAPFYKIYYTTDGSIPTQDSKQYTLPFAIERVNVLCQHNDEISVGEYQVYDADVPAANVVRTIAVAPDGTQGDVTTTTCFEQKEDITVISMIVDYDDLLDYDTGIMVKGRIYDEWIESDEAVEYVSKKQFWEYEGNYTQKGRSWERQALIEIYDNGEKIQIPAGIRIQGGMSRMYSQRGFNIYFREDYGAKSLNADIFGNGISKYKSLTLRNGGNAADSLKFKDSWIQGRLSGMRFSVLSSKPALVYINGEYWGLYILQEKYSDSFIREHFGIQDIVMVKDYEIEEGDAADLFDELLEFRTRDFSDPDVWENFKETVDIQSMADYFAAQIYIGNGDWTVDSNTCLWRSVEESEGYRDGRWRYMLYDTEYSSSLYGLVITSASYDHMGLAEMRFPLFAKAMQVEEFRELFDSSLSEVRSRFAPDDVRESLSSVLSALEKHMNYYYMRFGGYEELFEVESTAKYFEDRYVIEW